MSDLCTVVHGGRGTAILRCNYSHSVKRSLLYNQEELGSGTPCHDWVSQAWSPQCVLAELIISQHTSSRLGPVHFILVSSFEAFFCIQTCHLVSSSMADTRITGAIAIVAVPLDRRLVWEALQAAGATIDLVDGRHLPEGNKSLAGVGDRVIALVVTDDARDEGCKIGKYKSPRTNFPYLIERQAKPMSVSKKSVGTKGWSHSAMQSV